MTLQKILQNRHMIKKKKLKCIKYAIGFMRLDECANVLSIFKIIFHLRLHMTYSVTVLSIGHLCFGSQTQNDCSYVPKTKHKLTGMVNIHLGGGQAFVQPW